MLLLLYCTYPCHPLNSLLIVLLYMFHFLSLVIYEFGSHIILITILIFAFSDYSRSRTHKGNFSGPCQGVLCEGSSHFGLRWAPVFLSRWTGTDQVYNHSMVLNIFSLECKILWTVIQFAQSVYLQLWYGIRNGVLLYMCFMMLYYMHPTFIYNLSIVDVYTSCSNCTYPWKRESIYYRLEKCWVLLLSSFVIQQINCGHQLWY